MWSGVYRPIRVPASTFAPANRSRLAKSASPRSAAQCRAVIPSPCAAFTSAPERTSERTASRSPRWAASAMGASGGDAAPSNSANAIVQSIFMKGRLYRPWNPCMRPRLEQELARAVAEAGDVRVPELLHEVHEDVRHGCAVRRLVVQPSLKRPVAAPEKDERAATVVVQVGVTHRRAPHHDGLVEQAGVAVHGVLHTLHEVREHPHPVL